MIVRRAEIRWRPKERGGRGRPPSGEGPQPYATVVRFLDVDDIWPPTVAWTLVVRRVKLLDGPPAWLADVHFLAEDAPHHLLRSKAEFALYEGGRCVADGQVIGGSEVAAAGSASASAS